MRGISVLITFLSVVSARPIGLLAQQSETHSASPADLATAQMNGLTPLSAPYVVSTAPHTAIWLQFPKGDSIRRIALGDSSYFLAEADKDDPHYAIVKQIQARSGKSKQAIETNMVVYMASGRVINIILRSGEAVEKVFSIDYPLSKIESEHISPPAISPAEIEKLVQERANEMFAQGLIREMETSPKKDKAITSGGLTLRLYRTDEVGGVFFASFDVENTTRDRIDLQDPQLNLVTFGQKDKARRKKASLRVEPIHLLRASLSPEQLRPGERALGVVRFNPPVHDSNQQIVLSVANRAMADRPAQIPIE